MNQLGIHAFSDDDGRPIGFIECLHNFVLGLISCCTPHHHHHDESDDDHDWNYHRKKLIICSDELFKPVTTMTISPDSASVDVEIHAIQRLMDRMIKEDMMMIVQILALLAEEDGYRREIGMLKANPELIVQTMNEVGDTALHIAARSGKEDMVKHLVRFITTQKKKKKNKEGLELISLSQPNKRGDTPLHLALQQAHQHVASYLIRKKPHVAYKLNSFEVSPLYLAIRAGYLGLIEQLFIELPPRDLSTSTRSKLLQNKQAPVMHAAIEARQIGILQVLSTRLPFLIESKNEKGQTPISYAAYKGYHEEASYLLHKFPDITKIPDDDGTYPIHKAVFGDHVTLAASS